MRAIKQTAIGSHNHQETKIFNRPFDLVDICADKIGTILSTIARINFFQEPELRLVPPHMCAKNSLNHIDDANSIEIDKTYALWDEITSAISADASGAIAKDYQKAAYILNQLYLANFQRNFSGFKLHALGIYCQSVGGSLDEAHLLVHLIHFMYLSCQIGIKP
ncbi:hypothetical protein SAMN05216299_1393 [Nitrosospira sp. Nsp14]|nr:hypothetical protein SAMN05216299_1393 [Nitrosospira sp. Nsp14]